jgi:FKBP-type peptidyl-prolyl cis-trans isomerase FklB
MRKFISTTALIISAATFSAGTARAQQPAAAPANPPPAAQDKTTTPPAAKPAKPEATKSGTASGAKTAAPLTLATTKDKLSYALGMNFGENLHKQSVAVDTSIVVRGMKDGLAGGKTLMTEEEARTAITDLMAGLRKQHEEQMQKAGEGNKKEGDTFLAANKSKPGVVALPSGLQYKILQAGTGPKPVATDSVVCNYRGTLIDGKEFDSSYKRGQPATFPVGGVIKGWTEALQLMPVGSKWQLFIPSELAYGPRGAGADIGPNATLIFEVELLSIQEKGK